MATQLTINPPRLPVFQGCRFYKSNFLSSKPDERILYLRNINKWEFLGALALIFIQTWLGDALVVSEITTVSEFRPWSHFHATIIKYPDLPVLHYMEQQPMAHLHSRLFVTLHYW